MIRYHLLNSHLAKQPFNRQYNKKQKKANININNFLKKTNANNKLGKHKILSKIMRHYKFLKS